jgi:hypothetical protein
MRNLTLALLALFTITGCQSAEKPKAAEQQEPTQAACKQFGGEFTPPDFCAPPKDALFAKFGGSTVLPEGWHCANPPYDEDPSYGKCLNPKTKAFDWNYCVKKGIPKTGCRLIKTHA